MIHLFLAAVLVFAPPAMADSNCDDLSAYKVVIENYKTDSNAHALEFNMKILNAKVQGRGKIKSKKLISISKLSPEDAREELNRIKLDVQCEGEFENLTIDEVNELDRLK